MEVSEDVVFNFFKDCTKKDVNPIELAKLLKEYRKTKNITQKQLAQELGMPRNTLNNKEAFDRITVTQWEQLEKKGYSKTEITNAVRNNKVNILLNSEVVGTFDKLIQDVNMKLNVYLRSKPDVSSQSSILLYKLKETIMKLEQVIKR